MSLHSCLLSADVSRQGRQGKVSAVRWGQVSLCSSPLPTHPAPCMPLLSFTALNLSGCSFWQRRTMLLCAEVPEGQSKRQCGGWEKREKKEIQSVSQSGAFVCICACFGACHSASPSSQEGRAERRRGSFAASSLPAALDTREGNHRAGRDAKASSSSTACLPRTPSPRRRHGYCQQALAPQLR